jgi:hypothetical protein
VRAVRCARLQSLSRCLFRFVIVEKDLLQCGQSGRIVFDNNVDFAEKLSSVDEGVEALGEMLLF